jgi:osmotically-inducible protein OsmY
MQLAFGKAEKEQSMSDKDLRQYIIDELDFEPSVDAAHIGVAVEKDVVTLTGHVRSYVDKLAAVAATRRVRGVHAIAEEIEVRYPSDKKTADDEIARRAIDIIRWSAVVPEDAIQVTVRDGWVTVGGQVNWWYQRNAAEDVARKLSGVSGIINNITIRPHVQPTDVKRKIEDAFKRRAELDTQGIRVAVIDGGKITLEGRVRDWREHSAAVDAVWSAPGVVSVEDHLTIL